MSFFSSVSGLSPAVLFPPPSLYRPARPGSLLPWAFLLTASNSSCIVEADGSPAFFGLYAGSFFSAGISTSFSEGGGDVGLSFAAFAGGGEGFVGGGGSGGGAAFFSLASLA